MITRLGFGGAESVALSLIRGLHSKFDFGVFAVRGMESGEIGRTMLQELAELRVPVFRGANVPLRAGGMLVGGIRAAGVVRQFQPAIVHLHAETPEAVCAAMMALQPYRAPPTVVRTIHTSGYWQFWPALGRWCERRLRSSHIACVSRDAQTSFTLHREKSRAGPLPAPVTLIYNAVAASNAPPRQRDPSSPVRVLFAARFEPEKGADLLPRVITQIRSPPSGVELLLYGHGSYQRSLEELAADPPSGWKIHVRPPVANLRQQMSQFDLIIIPSRFEGLSLVAIEAALAGLPVVGTDAPGLREILPPDHRWQAKAGDAASLIEQLQRAVDEPGMWPIVAARTRAFAHERFNYQRMLDSYSALYVRARPAVQST